MGDYSVSLKAPGRNKHFRVHVEGTLFCIGQRKFPTLQQLVEHYQRAPIYTSQKGEKLFLIRPLPKWTVTRITQMNDYPNYPKWAGTIVLSFTFWNTYFSNYLSHMSSRAMKKFSNGTYLIIKNSTIILQLLRRYLLHTTLNTAWKKSQFLFICACLLFFREINFSRKNPKKQTKRQW